LNVSELGADAPLDHLADALPLGDLVPQTFVGGGGGMGRSWRGEAGVALVGGKPRRDAMPSVMPSAKPCGTPLRASFVLTLSSYSSRRRFAMAAIGASPPVRSARLGLRATPEQEAVLRRAAEVTHKSLTDFILDSACLAAEQTLLDQRLFMVSGSQAQALMDLLDRPEEANEGLRDLFARQAPWDAQ
jgi:uncharacterized protein (DUF1778 family)